MNVAFVILALIMIVYLTTRRIDLLSVAIVCLIIYNIYCATGYVYISSHEKAHVYYYAGKIQTSVYLVVLTQMLFLLIYTIRYDKRKKLEMSSNETPQNRTTILDDYETEKTFSIVSIICYIILFSNIATIGISGLSAAKAEVWAQTNILYSTGQWLSMSIFTYGMKSQKYKYSFIGLLPVLVHLFIGSRAFFAVIAIVFLVYYGSRLKSSFRANIKLYILGFVGLFLIMIYKKIFAEVKALDIDSIRRILSDPDTYMWFFRWGEPRIVLANFNYVIENHIKLDGQSILNRIICFIPFLDNVFSGGNRLMSSLVIGQLNSTYGLASNIWGEFYAIGSYPLIFFMYFIWIKIISTANDRLHDDDWTTNFLVPLTAYYSYYIHRMDFVKVVGNAKMLFFAMIIYWFIYSIGRRQFIIHNRS